MSKADHVLVDQQARLARTRTTYQAKRASSTEAAAIVWALVHGFAQGAEPTDRTG